MRYSVYLLLSVDKPHTPLPVYHALIHFISAEIMKLAEILIHIIEVNGKNIFNYGMVKKWVEVLKD